MWKLYTSPAAFSRSACTKVMKRIQRGAHCRRLKEAALQRGAKCYMLLCHDGAETERHVPGELSGDRVQPPSRWARHSHPAAGFISWAQQERRLGFVPQKQSVTHGVCGMLLHASAYTRNCVWTFSFSHSGTISICLSDRVQLLSLPPFLLFTL